ncbi:Uncharacterized protein conserved in bacteria [Serratia odorifera]|uniref:Uncharacterized protein conserved in bacteria n=1 Tax=Serratia odorifera TaxID=618 RepID=A0A3S5D851_SEROD|nr:Uncharacterized protein conserved in bacteria [Serratia odorifera]
MLLGVIADDFTGATDIASFLVENGLPTVQLNGVPQDDSPLAAQAVVIGLKSRSCPVEQAVEQSLQALAWLQRQGCQQFYFKYCSTFDSTTQGNIGPVYRRAAQRVGRKPDGDFTCTAGERPHGISRLSVCYGSVAV